MYPLKKYIELLDKSKSSSPQEQLALVDDIKRRGFLKSILDVVLLGAAGTCCAAPSEYNSVLPDIGDYDRTNLSKSEANFLGKQIIQDALDKGSMLNDYDILAYLNDIGSELASYSSLAGQSFKFYIIKDKIINAFALPGGYICLYNGLIYTTRSEAELTSVMSHEIGHVAQHHIFRNIAAYKRNQWLALAGILSSAMLATANSTAGALAMNSSQGLATQNMLSNSRDFEREADRVGQKIMYNAGFDPHAMPEFFKRLKDTTKFNDSEAFEFLRTHPVTSQRISEAEERANQLKVRMRPDSLNFLLMREKCRVRQLDITAAINFYQNALKTKKYASLDAQYYGMSFAQLLDNQLANANISLNKINDQAVKKHPAVISLHAQIQTMSKNYVLANKLYEQGLEYYPAYKNLWLGQIDLYMKAKQYILAAQKLDKLSQSYPLDIDIWSREGNLYSDSALNNEQKYHYALGNKLYLLGNYKEAMAQYYMALAVINKNVDSNLNDVISSRIIETREIIHSNRQYST